MIATIAGYEVDIDLEEGDTVADVMVLCRVQRLDSPGMSALVLASTDHTDGIVQTGIVHSAVNIIAAGGDDE